MKTKKKVMTFADFVNGGLEKSKKEMVAQKHKTSLSAARGSETEQKTIESLNLKTGYWSLRSRILKSKWVTDGNPFRDGATWLFKTVFQNPKEYQYRKMLMYQGGLFTFKYFNPKYKDTSVLPFFDQFPLVLSLGPVVTNNGVRNLGFNLHLLPPKIRIIVICHIFELYKKLYRYQIYFKRENPVQIRYEAIVKQLDKYSVRFCIRMYIPRRQRQIVCIPYREWHKGVFIPSLGYYGIRASKLVDEWKKYSAHNKAISNANIDWKTLI